MENPRRLTVSIDDMTYVKLVDYAAELSKQRLGRFSLSEALRGLVPQALEADARGGGPGPVMPGSYQHGR